MLTLSITKIMHDTHRNGSVVMLSLINELFTLSVVMLRVVAP